MTRVLAMQLLLAAIGGGILHAMLAQVRAQHPADPARARRADAMGVKRLLTLLVLIGAWGGVGLRQHPLRWRARRGR
jgi:hypothetical protein